MVVLRVAEIALIALAVVSYVADAVLRVLHCSTGFLGYPDVWDSEEAEKWDRFLTRFSLACFALFAVVLVVFNQKILN